MSGLCCLVCDCDDVLLIVDVVVLVGEPYDGWFDREKTMEERIPSGAFVLFLL